MKSTAHPSNLLDLIRGRLAATLTRTARATPQPPAVRWPPAAGRPGNQGSAARSGREQTGIPPAARIRSHAEPTITLDPDDAQRQRAMWAAQALTGAAGD